MFVECQDWRYGCCEDRQTFADGPAMQGCASIYVISVKISGRDLILSYICIFWEFKGGLGIS